MADTRRESIARLKESLPEATASDIDAKARAVLRYVLEPHSRIVLAPPLNGESGCPNCFAPVKEVRSPYCDERCREMAGFVRQFRAGLQLGWILDSEKQVALGQVLWHLLGGGRPLRQHIAPQKAREAALKRDGWICQVCGAPATTVDHLRTGCNRPINLRAVCESCCEDLPFGDESVLSRPEVLATIAELSARIHSDTALKCCDDAETWDWRAYVAKRKQPNIVARASRLR